MFWNILLLSAMWLVGIVLGAFGLVQILLCVFASGPIIRKLAKVGAIDSRRAAVSNSITVFVWVLLLSIAFYLLHRFGNEYAKIGMFVGVGMAVVFSLKKLSPNNPDNIIDFLQSHLGCITEPYLRRAILDNDPDIMFMVYGIAISGFYAAANQSADDGGTQL